MVREQHVLVHGAGDDHVGDEVVADDDDQEDIAVADPRVVDVPHQVDHVLPVRQLDQLERRQE